MSVHAPPLSHCNAVVRFRDVHNHRLLIQNRKYPPCKREIAGSSPAADTIFAKGYEFLRPKCDQPPKSDGITSTRSYPRCRRLLCMSKYSGPQSSPPSTALQTPPRDTRTRFRRSHPSISPSSQTNENEKGPRQDLGQLSSFMHRRSDTKRYRLLLDFGRR